MAKDKERSVNPAAAQRKAEKQKAIKKNKSSAQAVRNEKLARRNPDRLQKQIDDLKALESSGDLKPREKAILEELEKDLRAIRKAREALGDKAPKFGSGNYRTERDATILGKRRHDGERKEYQEPISDSSETDDDVRRIPMPKDTPPPMPRQYKTNAQGTSANNEPLGSNRHSLPAKPAAPSQTTYSSAPKIRDLKQEAVKRFVPNVVRQKQQAVKGVGGLVEPEELDRLEAEGYGTGGKKISASAQAPSPIDSSTHADAFQEARRLAEEEERFRREMEMDGIETTAEHAENTEMEAVKSVDQTLLQNSPPITTAMTTTTTTTTTTTNKTRKPLQALVEDVSDEDI